MGILELGWISTICGIIMLIVFLRNTKFDKEFYFKHIDITFFIYMLIALILGVVLLVKVYFL